jgi:uncharacterized repeat protein (TIGR03803 family)
MVPILLAALCRQEMESFMAQQGEEATALGLFFPLILPLQLTKKLKDFDYNNGAIPSGSLMQASDGKLYGMTNMEGSADVGVIFSFDPSTSTYTKVKDFNGVDGADGGGPEGSLIQARDGKLYGMTSQGGSNNAGVIFSFDLSTSTYTELKDFDNINGARSYGSLMQASDGKLYGMTRT